VVAAAAAAGVIVWRRRKRGSKVYATQQHVAQVGSGARAPAVAATSEMVGPVLVVELPRGRLGVTLGELPGGGVYVESLAADSPVADGRLLPGDALVSLNGLPLGDADAELAGSILADTVDAPRTLCFRRGGSAVAALGGNTAATPALLAPIQLVPTGAVKRSILITRQDSAGNDIVQEREVAADSTGGGAVALLPQGAILRKS